MTSHSEEEELAQIRAWWQRYGKPLLAAVVVALLLLFGWQGWQKYRAGQAQAASLIYQQLLEAVLAPGGKPDPARVSELSGQLQNQFPATAYAQYGSLLLAKVAVESGHLEDAAAKLREVLDQPAEKPLGELARQRLARVLAAQDKAEEGLGLLDGEVDAAFLASREEVKGDLLVQLGRTDEARAAYQKAKAALADDTALGGLQIKLDDLAKEDA